MQYRIFVQNPSVEHFVASIVEMPTLMVEGKTEIEAITKVKIALENQLAQGKFVMIDIDDKQDSVPQMKYAGILADDPTFDDWIEKLAAIRKEANTMED